MADHLDSPGPIAIKDPTAPSSSPEVLANVGPPMGLGHAATDITDIYAFQKPGGASKSILIMNVNPLATLLAPSFESDAIYRLNVDTNRDAIADLRFDVRFSSVSEGTQTATVQLVTNLEEGGDPTLTVISGAPVSFGTTPMVTSSPDGAYKFFAGLRSDPFFFDLLGFLEGFDFSFGDFFVDKNVFGIVLEVPNSALGSNPSIGVWGRTLVNQAGTLVNDDRMGRPAINTVFNHGTDKITFNQIDPDLDRELFLEKFVDVLEALAPSRSPSANEHLAHFLLPDILTYNSSSASGFPNGRQLADDVIDIELNLLTAGAVTTDNVGPHISGPNRYLDHFPYLGTPS